MQISRDKTKQLDHEVEVEGLPVVRRNVAGIDLGSTQHWVCAPKKDGTGREVEPFGATTPELEKMAEWLKERNVESVAMESTGVYWIPPHEILERHGLEVVLVNTRELARVPGRKKTDRGLVATNAEESGPDECTGAPGGIGYRWGDGVGHYARCGEWRAGRWETSEVAGSALPQER